MISLNVFTKTPQAHARPAPTPASDRYRDQVEEFIAEAARRERRGDPRWEPFELEPALVHSLQRFQVGEDGDGAQLIAKADAAGDPSYALAARLFVAEERNHARQLRLLLAAGGAGTLTGHWTDAAFVRVRRLLGLRLELMTLMIAEAVALRYYRALRDGAREPLVREVAGRILADEERHVPFHCRRLSEGWAGTSARTRRVVAAAWRAGLVAAGLVVVWDHGAALRACGVGRGEFVRDLARSGGPLSVALVNPHPSR
ncbi:ferritin-like domain-containing protein [Streptomyces sp. BI20]|uniref:ferritin-like domain-containing protein n=1 Tax=Streptomyces sp. BI20 TaxID=3403460 RepID=UPI003C74B16C